MWRPAAPQPLRPPEAQIWLPAFCHIEGLVETGHLCAKPPYCNQKPSEGLLDVNGQPPWPPRCLLQPLGGLLCSVNFFLQDFPHKSVVAATVAFLISALREYAGAL